MVEKLSDISSRNQQLLTHVLLLQWHIDDTRMEREILNKILMNK